MASLAELLAYKQKQAEMLNPQPSLGDRIESLSYAAGEGFADQLRGLQQLATHPIQSAKDIYSGVKYAVQNPRQAAQAAVEGLKGAVQSPESATRFIAQNVSPVELANALKNVGTMREIVVHHGTPHRFEPTEANSLGEFDAGKIGTGEGAAAYGHGIYFAENPEVSMQYLRGNKNFGISNWDSPVVLADKAFAQAKGNKEAAIELLQNLTNKSTGKAFKNNIVFATNILKRDGQKTSLYKADLPDEMVDRMLDWDKPLSEQSKAVQKTIKDYAVLSNIKIDPSMKGNEIYALFGKDATKGQDLAFNEFGKMQKAAAEQLRWADIPGIKYLDAGSRGQVGTGTRNFVVFPGEEKKVKILERK